MRFPLLERVGSVVWEGSDAFQSTHLPQQSLHLPISLLVVDALLQLLHGLLKDFVTMFKMVLIFHAEARERLMHLFKGSHVDVL